MNCLSNWVALWNWVEHFSRFSVRHHRWTAPLPPVESNVVVHFLIFALLALWPVVNRGNSVVFSVRHSIDSWNFAMNLKNWYMHDISDLTSDLLVKSEMHKKTTLIYDNHLYFQWIWSIIKISAIAQIYEKKKHTSDFSTHELIHFIKRNCVGDWLDSFLPMFLFFFSHYVNAELVRWARLHVRNINMYWTEISCNVKAVSFKLLATQK